MVPDICLAVQDVQKLLGRVEETQNDLTQLQAAEVRGSLFLFVFQFPMDSAQWMKSSHVDTSQQIFVSKPVDRPTADRGPAPRQADDVPSPVLTEGPSLLDPFCTASIGGCYLTIGIAPDHSLFHSFLMLLTNTAVG